METCPNCDVKLVKGAIFCEKCGTKVPTKPENLCPKCGTQLVEGAAFCDRCGAGIDAERAPEPSPAKTRAVKPTPVSAPVASRPKRAVVTSGKKSSLLALGAILIVMMIVLVAGATYVIAPAFEETQTEAPNLTQTTKVVDHVLSCAYKVYADKETGFWVAKTLVKNVGNVPVYDYKITYKLGDYTGIGGNDVYKEIVPGQTVIDYYYPSISSSVMELTTKTTVNLQVSWEYKTKAGKTYSDSKTYQTDMLGKHTFVFSSLPESEQLGVSDAFSNRNLLATFVTQNEPTIKNFAVNATSGLNMRTDDNDAIEAFGRAFYALRERGVGYMQEPSNAWESHFNQYVRYPKDVINPAGPGGTCLDLAICMATIMEAVGVSTIIYMIPGHAIPAIITPNQGQIVPVESTFVDQNYAITHYPNEVPQGATFEECYNSAVNNINSMYQNQWVLPVDVHAAWESGIVPPE